MYGMSFPVTKDVLDKDYVIPIGKAKIEREGEITWRLGGFSEHLLNCARLFLIQGPMSRSFPSPAQ